MKKCLLLTLNFLFGVGLMAQDPTWSEDIACIIYSHCSPCHNQETNASFPLLTYSDVFNNRLAVEIYVNTLSMPPALPDKKYSHLQGNRHLTENEIDLIKNWARDLALEGNPNLAPSAPVFPKKTNTLKNPDISYTAIQYFQDSFSEHLRKCYIINSVPIGFTKIKSIEIIPQNGNQVHAAYWYSDTSKIPLKLDAEDIRSGYEHFFGTGSYTSKPLFGWNMDTKPFTLPPNINLGIDSGSYLILQIQYAESASGNYDSTRINIKWDTSLVNRPAKTEHLLNTQNHLLNGPLIIPIDSVKEFYQSTIINEDISLLNVSPNVHHFCERLKVYAILPSSDTIGLLKIDDWKAEWSMGTYYFQKPVYLPKGTLLNASSLYSNTRKNLHDPDDSLTILTDGPDENMEEMKFSFTYLPYLINDENLQFDTSEHTPHYNNCDPKHSSIFNPIKNATSFDVYPNPANYNITIKSTEWFNHLEIFNVLGQSILQKKLSPTNDFTLDISLLKQGNYYIKASSANLFWVKKLIKL